MASGQQARAAFEQVFRQFRDQARKSGMGGNGGGGGQGGGPNLGGLLGCGAGLALLIGGGLAINSSLIDYDVRAKPRSIASLTGTKGELGGERRVSTLMDG